MPQFFCFLHNDRFNANHNDTFETIILFSTLFRQISKISGRLFVLVGVFLLCALFFLCFPSSRILTIPLFADCRIAWVSNECIAKDAVNAMVLLDSVRRTDNDARTIGRPRFVLAASTTAAGNRF
jgi:hypothetical protein